MPEFLFNKLAGLRLQACNSIKIETLAQVFSCGFSEISKNTFSYRTPPVAVSGHEKSAPHFRTIYSCDAKTRYMHKNLLIWEFSH